MIWPIAILLTVFALWAVGFWGYASGGDRLANDLMRAAASLGQDEVDTLLAINRKALEQTKVVPKRSGRMTL